MVRLHQLLERSFYGKSRWFELIDRGMFLQTAPALHKALAWILNRSSCRQIDPAARSEKGSHPPHRRNPSLIATTVCANFAGWTSGFSLTTNSPEIRTESL